MLVFVLNAGSSSLKYQLMNPVTKKVLASGICERIGIDGVLKHEYNDGKKLVLNEVKGKTISLYPFPSTKNITTIGLQWPLNNEYLELTKRIGTRNVAVEEMVTIHFESGDLVVFVSN